MYTTADKDKISDALKKLLQIDMVSTKEAAYIEYLMNEKDYKVKYWNTGEKFGFDISVEKEFKG